jgi:molecular chaperone DnaJ
MQKYYDILGVDSNTTKEEVKKKFRKLSMQYHPDRGGDARKFNDILEAYKFITTVNGAVDKIDNNKKAADEFFKAMFGSKYGPYSRRN